MKPKKPTLTREELLVSLTPDLERGVFIRNATHGPGKKGSIAGSPRKNGYWGLTINSQCYTAHRVMWFFIHGVWPDEDIDHINGDRADNRIENLRLAVRSQNNVNSLKPKNNTSGFKGAYFDRRKGRSLGVDGRWASEIWIFKKKKFLGYFDTAAEAGAAYQDAVRKHYGEFAPTRTA